MPKIRGKFAPLFEELGIDDRWLIGCNDHQKFLYILVLHSIYSLNNSAPDDPYYYKRRYVMRRRLGAITADLEHIKSQFPKLICKDKRLSLFNYKGYENTVAPIGNVETEREIDKEKEVEPVDNKDGAFSKERTKQIKAQIQDFVDQTGYLNLTRIDLGELQKLAILIPKGLWDEWLPGIIQGRPLKAQWGYFGGAFNARIHEHESEMIPKRGPTKLAEILARIGGQK